ncbi:MAG: HPr family phosphocarrier protein [Candidatus Eiseniibacteriota bacterium]|nr:MAG: HPr family phosphocarrier protein [Candidatus Eisenbacteria bacterium]
MIERTITITSDPGIHLRAAAIFVKEAGRFRSTIWVMKDGIEVNGKSILGLVSLVAEKGSSITIKADGEDQDEALTSLSSLVENRFGE